MLTRFIKAYYQYIVVFTIVLIIFITNYKPSTYLMGWDNLQTDLNPILGIKRSFFAVWQEYQSFGLTSGLSHAADLVRSIFIWALSLVLPSNLLRYTYNFLMIFIGGIGILKLINRDQQNDRKWLGLLGSLFYILNYGTVQIFFLPWESFSTFFAFLPWELWIFLKLLENPKKKKDWLVFSVINILASPQAYIQTIFIVYMLILMCITVGYSIEKKSAKILKNALCIIFTIIFLNLFWILPQIYSLITRADIIGSAKNNLISTENVFYQNLEKGTLWHFLRMEGFYSDLYGKNKTFLFLPWKEHFSHLTITIVALLLSLISLIGIVGSLFRKTAYRIAYLFIFILVAIALLGKVFPFDRIHELLSNFSLMNQIFRSPFTKFVIPYALVASYGFAMGVDILYGLLQRRTFLKIHKNYILIFFGFLIFIYSLPSFKGNYISPEMKVNIPSSYLEAIKFFENEDKNKRIALLPNYTYWGWFSYGWGYAGSGFLWYGIEQPIVSRTFDVWSNNSESYFWEEKAALEAEDVKQFEKILEKYNIDYLLYDKSLTPIVGSTKAIQYDRLDQILKKSTNITQIRKWGELSIYGINHKQKIDAFVKISPSLPNIGPGITLTNSDTAYLNHGEYMTTSEEPFDIYYPFLDLTTQTNITKKTWNIFEFPSEWIFTSYLPFNPKPYSFVLPNEAKFNLYMQDSSANFILPISSNIESNSLMIHFPKMKISNFDLTQGILKNCSNAKGFIDKENQDASILIASRNSATGCIAYVDPNLNQKYGYLVKVANKNISGQKLFFYILDNTKEQVYLENRLRKDVENYIIAPRFEQGIGYSFIFNENSYENIESANKLISLDVYLMPYDDIKNISLRKTNVEKNRPILETKYDVKKINYYSYLVSVKSPLNNTIILYQSFDAGWKAYQVQSSKFKVQSWISNIFPFLFGKELKEHVLVNNWANGWTLNSDKQQATSNRIIIVFWPQYLEYLGFAILIGTFAWILWSIKRKPKQPPSLQLIAPASQLQL